MSLAMARIRLLTADAYRLGCRDKSEPNRDAARELVSQALRDLEMVLQGIRDATIIDHGQRRAGDTAAWIRGAALSIPRDASPEFAAGWREAVLHLADRAFPFGTPEFQAIERLCRSD